MNAISIRAIILESNKAVEGPTFLVNKELHNFRFEMLEGLSKVSNQKEFKKLIEKMIREKFEHIGNRNEIISTSNLDEIMRDEMIPLVYLANNLLAESIVFKNLMDTPIKIQTLKPDAIKYTSTTINPGEIITIHKGSLIN